MDPFWAAIIGGAVGGVLVAVVESFLSRSREHEKWLREQRQRIYLDFVELAEEASSSHERALDAASRLDIAEVGEIMRAASRLEAEMGAAVRKFDVVASPSMTDRAYRLRFLNTSFWRAAAKFPSTDFADRDAALKALEAMQGPWISPSEMRLFTEAARRELGAGRDFVRRLTSRYRMTKLNRWWVMRKARVVLARQTEVRVTDADADTE